MKKTQLLTSACVVSMLSLANQGALASCADIFTAASGKATALLNIIGQPDNGGYGLPMWVTAVDETGKVCVVFNTSGKAGSANIGNSSWLGSRVISAQKANTANAFSLDAFSIATGNLYGLALDGGSLFGLQFSNPVDASIAYQGAPETYGTSSDPLIGKRIGGINVFGGGLALYNSSKVKVGAIGVSGDTSCTDHAVAWKIRKVLGLDNVPGGFISGSGYAVSYPAKGDEIIIKLSGNSSTVQNTYKQVSCAHNAINNPTPGAETGVIIEP